MASTRMGEILSYSRLKMCPSTRGGIAPPALIALLVFAGGAAAEPCKLGRVAQLPVTMENRVPLVHAAINGKDALFVADSGAFFSTLTPAAAKQFNLPLQSAEGLLVEGVGGTTFAWMTTVKTFTIFGVDLPRIPFYVFGNDVGGGAVGLLGQNVFRIGDVDYDLANGMISLLRAHGDCKKTSLAYWANSAGVPYSQIDIDFASVERPHTMGNAFLNGKRIRVMFDTGADSSLLSLDAARRAGVTPQSPGVESGGSSYGIGRHEVPTWVGHFASFRIGDEEIRNARLTFGDASMQDVDMLVGADFFLSHHVLVATSQHSLYFTYNGGPVFSLTTAPAAPAAGAASATAPAPANTPAPADAAAASQPQPQLDAAGYARRGSASASRRDYARAIADLSRAVELDPAQADYFYERGSAYQSASRPDEALQDFTHAITLRPDHVPALMARAQLRLERHDPAANISPDLEAADRAAPKEAEVRLDLGDLYLRVRDYDATAAEYSHWIDSHDRSDVQMPRARAARCWARALIGRELEPALEDCNAAVKASRGNASVLDSRGLVYLRLGKYDKAIRDYDAALALDPKIPWSLYGRGLAKRHLGQTAAGDTDIAAAKALAPKIADEAASHGIVP
jgi:tetratricopeptide (TPR) repeat protein/predicted aspartyl protease